MLKWLINFTKGILSIRIRGVYIDRLLNICLKNNIGLWDIKRVDNYEITSKIGIKSFKKLCKLGSSTKCRVHITQKKGVPFTISRFKYRPVLFVGLALFIASLYIAGNFVWSINIDGNNGVDSAKIIETLDSLNIRIGTKTKNIEPSIIKNEMMLAIPEISFIAINPMGNELSIQVKERELAPEIFDENARINIISDKDAVIDSIDIKAGYSDVLPGSTVLKGDILVSSIIPFETEGGRAQHALADIKARTWHENTRVLLENAPAKQLTGKNHSKYHISAFGKRYNLYFNKNSPYENYDKTYNDYKIKLNSSFTFPIYIAREQFLEYNLIDTPLIMSDVQNLMINYAKRDLQKSIKGDIISFEHNISTDNGLIKFFYKSECLENIGVESVDTRNIEDYITKPEA